MEASQAPLSSVGHLIRSRMAGIVGLQEIEQQLNEFRIRLDRLEKEKINKAGGNIWLKKAFLKLPYTFDFETERSKVSRYASSLGEVQKIKYNYDIVRTGICSPSSYSNYKLKVTRQKSRFFKATMRSSIIISKPPRL